AMLKISQLALGLILAAQVALAFSGKSGLRPRQYDNQTQVDIERQAKDDPLGATEKVKKMPNLGTPGYESFAKHKYGAQWLGDSSSHHQVSWFDNGKFPFTQPAGAPRNSDGGLTSVPSEVEDFELKDDIKLKGDAVQPYYISKDYNPKDVKRAVIVFPGLPRDAWKWATLMHNAFKYVYTKHKYCYQKKDAIILSPLTLNQQDKAAVKNDNWAVYKNANWQVGGVTHSPSMDHGVSYFTAIDKMIDMLFDKSKYPNLDKVVLVGHSMGAQAVQHYGMLRKSNDEQDSKLLWWIGNPGAWTWLNAGRPTYWPNCDDKLDVWPYGLKNINTKVSYNTNAKRHELVDAFLQRDTQIALGLDDNGAGNTHCQAYYQGANHLDRGSNFVQSVAGMPGGFPSNFEVNYVAHVAHQDYPMFAANRSLDFIWGKDFDGDCSAASDSVTTVTATANQNGGQDCGNGDIFGGGICISGSGNGNNIQIS
ncbi:hypothetical protein MCAP1_001077, partial [Malassezia caprae]